MPLTEFWKTGTASRSAAARGNNDSPVGVSRRPRPVALEELHTKTLFKRTESMTCSRKRQICPRRRSTKCPFLRAEEHQAN